MLEDGAEGVFHLAKTWERPNMDNICRLSGNVWEVQKSQPENYSFFFKERKKLYIHLICSSVDAFLMLLVFVNLYAETTSR